MGDGIRVRYGAPPHKQVERKGTSEDVKILDRRNRSERPYHDRPESCFREISDTIGAPADGMNGA